MKVGDPLDTGLYFFLLIVPFLLIVWSGNLLKKRIITSLQSDHPLNQNLVTVISVSVQIVLIFVGMTASYFLTKFI